VSSVTSLTKASWPITLHTKVGDKSPSHSLALEIAPKMILKVCESLFCPIIRPTPSGRWCSTAPTSRIHHMIRRLRWAALCVLVWTAFLSFSTGLLGQEGSGMPCVAPFPKPVCSNSGDVCLAQGFSCTSGKVSLKVDSRKAMPWPKKESMRLTGYPPPKYWTTTKSRTELCGS
jgi:hypothetical protein